MSSRFTHVVVYIRTSFFFIQCAFFIIKEIRAGRIAPVGIVGLLLWLTCWSLPGGHKSTGKPELKTECRKHDPLAKNSTEQTSIRELEGARQIFIWETDSIGYPDLWMNPTEYLSNRIFLLLMGRPGRKQVQVCLNSSTGHEGHRGISIHSYYLKENKEHEPEKHIKNRSSSKGRQRG